VHALGGRELGICYEAVEHAARIGMTSLLLTGEAQRVGSQISLLTTRLMSTNFSTCLPVYRRFGLGMVFEVCMIKIYAFNR